MATAVNEESQHDEEEQTLKKLECPFSWLMDDIDSTVVTNYKPHDEEETILILKLMRIIMTVYEQVKEDENENVILENLEKCDEIVTTLKDEEPEAFCDAVNHVVQSTKYHALKKLGKEKQAKKLLNTIKTLDPGNKIERSTIAACQGICWSKYHHLGKEDAVKYIKEALEDNPDYHVWHFILGKNLRRIRRDGSVGEQPCREEQMAFLNAYEKSRNVVYGLYVAQMHREARQNALAINMYEEVLRKRPSSDTIYLRLALGFMQLFKLPQAGRCLDEVQHRCADDSIYLHYRGKYYMKTKKFNEAAKLLRKAADTGNYPASKDYIRCMKKINPHYNVTDYLLSLIEVFKNLPEKQLQGLFLDIALCYLNKGELEKSMKYFLQSIEIDPKNDSITKYYSILDPGRALNVYNELKYKVFPKVNQRRESLDESTLEMYDELKNYYDEFQEYQFQSTQKAFAKVHT